MRLRFRKTVIGLIGIITLNYVFHFSRGHAELKIISEDYIISKDTGEVLASTGNIKENAADIGLP